MQLIDRIYERATKLQKWIALPEATEERNLKAAIEIQQKRFAKVILVGAEGEIISKAKSLNLDVAGFEIADPAKLRERTDYVDQLVELRRKKGMTTEKARELLSDPLYCAAMMVKKGEADGFVAGAIHATGDVLRPALQIIKTAKGIKTVSSFFIMVLPDTSPYAQVQKELFFADCAVVPDPDVEQLADIALSTANSFSALISDSDPRVAMLSFSTKGSGQHDVVDKVTAATELVKEKNPRLLVDGELQADAALISKVGALKAPDSGVAGKANILVFPDLNAGNIGYKLVQRLAGASAIGPVIQGLDKPVNDLSRGCSVQDIIDTVAVTACQCSMT